MAPSEFHVSGLCVRLFSSKLPMGVAAAAQAASILREAVRARGHATIIVGTGNSQLELIDALGAERDIDWKSIEIFHLDEYVGVPANHPASFRRWLKTHLADKVHPGKVHYIEGDAADLEKELARYGALLSARSIDLSFVGFGENGHIAFNDPHVADFSDPLTIKRVTLDHACRKQQEGEGHFPTIDAVPSEALTLTCPAILRSAYWICCVPDRRKAQAVKCALEGPLSPKCPASLARRHPRAFLYLDEESAALLSPQLTRTTS